MKSNLSRLRRIESLLSPHDNIVYGITSHLDDRIPVGSYGVLTNGSMAIHTEEEYFAIMETIPVEELIIIGGGEDE